MLVLKILAILLGLAFTLFGHFIYFRKKHNLINGFEADFKAGRKNEDYAPRLPHCHQRQWGVVSGG